MILFRILFFLLRVIWYAFWGLYQLALGAIFVLIAWGLWQASQYLHVRDILALRHHSPKTTAFMEAEKQARLDSLRAAEAAGAKNLPDTTFRYRFIPMDSIPKSLRDMALVAEDAKFYSHHGFDLEEIEYALVANHQQGRKARGASTISQQVVKNLFLKPDKEMTRKLREAAMTYLMEETLTKDRILELYLNIAQFGPGVFGVAEGAEYHFGKSIGELKPEEQLGLVCLLPSPEKWSPRRNQTAYLLHKRRVVGNYALFKGIRDRSDTTHPGWIIQVYDSLSNRVNQDKWDRLRTSSGNAQPLDSAQAGSKTDSTSED